MSLKILIDPPVCGYTEVRRSKPGSDARIPGWHGLVLYGPDKRLMRVHRLVYENGVVPSWNIDLGARMRAQASTLVIALKRALGVDEDERN